MAENIATDYGYKNSDGNGNIILEPRKTEIDNVIVKDIGNHSSQEHPPLTYHLQKLEDLSIFKWRDTSNYSYGLHPSNNAHNVKCDNE